MNEGRKEGRKDGRKEGREGERELGKMKMEDGQRRRRW